MAFGPLATSAFYLALAPPSAAAAAVTPADVAAAVPPLVWLLSAIVGGTTTAILFCSHFHQIAGDIAAGKRSPLVRLGTAKATSVLTASTFAVYAALLAGCACGVVPAAAALAAVVSVPAAVNLVNFARNFHAEPVVIFALKFSAIRWHVALSAALIGGMMASGQLLAPL